MICTKCELNETDHKEVWVRITTQQISFFDIEGQPIVAFRHILFKKAFILDQTYMYCIIDKSD